MNLFLIGFRGSGKSTVAPLIADTLLWPVVDTDQEIQILTGYSISEIFESEGEAGFRQWETTVIQAFAQIDSQVISLGGGAPLSEENRHIIKRSGNVVWLTADAETLWRRISGDSQSSTQRPSLTDMDGFAEVVSLLEQRHDVYAACADYTIDTTHLNPEEIAEKIANWVDPVDT